jgi:uncharacterized membrane protein HdeD (DUF308 family)
MISRLLVFIGVVLILLGVLKYIGVFSYGNGTAVGEIVLGGILCLLGYYVFGPTGYYTRRGPRV